MNHASAVKIGSSVSADPGAEEEPGRYSQRPIDGSRRPDDPPPPRGDASFPRDFVDGCIGVFHPFADVDVHEHGLRRSGETRTMYRLVGQSRDRMLGLVSDDGLACPVEFVRLPRACPCCPQVAFPALLDRRDMPTASGYRDDPKRALWRWLARAPAREL
jgi:hypothetical protein